MLTRALRVVIVTGALAYVVMYVGIALLRLRYPFELEWMEGSMVEHVSRVARGQRIYIPPSMDFVPYVYPPLYYYISAVVALASGIGFFPLRLVSFAASLGAFAIIFSLVRRETGSRAAGILAMGLFAATFREGGSWFDTARVDSLFLLLLLGGVYLVRFATSPPGLVAAGALLALSALTKQTALLLVPTLTIYALIDDRRKGLAFIGGFVAVFGALTLTLDALHDGWYRFYVFQLPAQIVQDLQRVAPRFWGNDILRPMPVAVALSLGYSLLMLGRLRDRRNLFYPLLGATLVAASWTTRLHSGAFNNVLIPAYAGLAILSALAFHEMAQGITREALYAYTLYLVQLAIPFYSPREQVPTANDLALGHQLVEIVARAEGDVYLPWHSHIAAPAGKRSFAHSQAVADVFRAGDPETSRRLLDDISRAVRERRFQLIIVDRVMDLWLRPELEAHYVRVRPVFEVDGFYPLTGAPTRPEWIYMPR